MSIMPPDPQGKLDTPARIQRRRTKGWRMPEGAKYVGRPSRWGSPFVIGDTYMWLPDLAWPIPSFREPGVYPHGVIVERLECRATSVDWFSAWAPAAFPEAGPELRGYDLACWCPLDQPCHADVLLKLANA